MHNKDGALAAAVVSAGRAGNVHNVFPSPLTLTALVARENSPSSSLSKLVNGAQDDPLSSSRGKGKNLGEEGVVALLPAATMEMGEEVAATMDLGKEGAAALLPTATMEMDKGAATLLPVAAASKVAVRVLAWLPAPDCEVAVDRPLSFSLTSVACMCGGLGFSTFRSSLRFSLLGATKLSFSPLGCWAGSYAMGLLPRASPIGLGLIDKKSMSYNFSLRILREQSKAKDYERVLSSDADNLEGEMDRSVMTAGPGMDMPIMHDGDRYELMRDIGSGNFGVARLMKDKQTDGLVAVKYIERGEIVSARVMLTPTHLAIEMEYASGGELFERICNAGRFSEDEVLTLDMAHFFFQQLILGVSYCHAMVSKSYTPLCLCLLMRGSDVLICSSGKQVFHRYLKLENTLLDGSPAPRLKICDFGYSKVTDSGNIIIPLTVSSLVDRYIETRCDGHLHVHDNTGYVYWTEEQRKIIFRELRERIIAEKSSVLHSQPKSTVGTPAYTAPEVLPKKEYDGKVAFQNNPPQRMVLWSNFICYVGWTITLLRSEDPAEPKNFHKTIHRILNVQYSILDFVHVSPECRHLISRIFVADPAKRITILEIKNHDWFLKNLPADLMVENNMKNQFEEPDQPMQEH
ncbi:hypothetical protein SADUNF_Sadunf04G0100700 [Salix dunnii]|uniref:non-specific serine/threonine protein kinase n=1 Tax=Salix dunnii TaxID=1413687 RepID=A0A835KE52_9ROSI|nr:hypothetical protein SADUNF_Sadunf04G0100700 [Salix dunnii]